MYLDLAMVTQSAKVLCFVRDIPNREYPLVIPDPAPGWQGLAAGASYKEMFQDMFKPEFTVYLRRT